jgi:hypothetical protein
LRRPSSTITWRRNRTRFARLSISVNARSGSVIASGRPGSPADVGDSVAAQQRLEREALDEMPFDELLFVANTREVVDAVPADQEIEEPRERLAVRFRQLEARGAQAPPDVGRRQRSFDARHRRSMPPRALESVSVICAWVICAGLRAPR